MQSLLCTFKYPSRRRLASFLSACSYRTRTTAPNPQPHSESSFKYKDPWPLPHTPQHLASTSTYNDNDIIPPLPRHNESIEKLRARLVYQSRKRGTLESDLLLSTFATKEVLDGMSVEELREFDRLLDEQDWDIYYWATNRRHPPETWANSGVLERLRVHARNEGKVIRRMPSL